MILLRRFLYMCMLFAVLALNFMYVDYQFMMVLIILLAVFVIDFLLYRLSSSGIRVYTKDMQKYYTVGDRISAAFVYKGRFSVKLPNGRCKMQLSYSNDDSAEPVVYDVTSVEGKCSCRFVAKHVGIVNVRLLKLAISDYFRMFNTDTDYAYVKKIIVHPKAIDLYSLRHSIIRDIELIRQSFYENDNTEVVDLRVYQQGDTLNRIHWKRSFYGDDYIVKQFGETVKCTIRIIVDIEMDKEKSGRDVIDKIYTWCLSVGLLCIDKEAAGEYIAWDAAHGDYVAYSFENRDEVYEAMTKLYDLRPEKDSIAKLDNALKQHGIVTDDGSIFITSRDYEDDRYRVINVNEDVSDKA